MTSSMDRSEPSLVPEWLKGTAQNHSHFQGGLTRNSSFVQRHHQPFATGAFGERVLDRENNHYRSYPNFGRGRFGERNERDREVPGVGRHEWDWNRDRRIHDNNERFQAGGTGFNDGRFKSHGLHRLPGRPEIERPGLIENGEKKAFSWSTTNGVDQIQRSNLVDRKLTIRSAPSPSSVRTSNLVVSKSKLPDSPDSGTHTDTELASPSFAPPKMSEALIQMSSPPQQQSESQRLEEIALKQSRQLIPMKPSLPKTMGASRVKQMKTSDSKVSQPAGSLLPYRSPAAAPNGTKPTTGRLLVLKTSKNAASSPTSPSSGNVAPMKQVVDRKPGETASSNGRNGLAVHEERKPLVLSQNRSDFFNAIRRKAAANGENRNPHEHVRAEEGDESPSVKDVSHQTLEDHRETESNGTKQQFAAETVFCGSEEEEMNFLKSLGWVESAEGEDEALTTEEINSFLQKHPSVLNQNFSASRSSSGSDSDDESRK